MTTARTISASEDATRDWASNPDERPADLFARLASLDARFASPRERTGAFIDAIMEGLGGLAASLTIGAAGEEHEVQRHSPAEGAEAWTATLRATALEARSHARSIARLFGSESAPNLAVIASPIDTAGRDPLGGVALLIRCNSAAHAERLQLHLRAACLHAASALTQRRATTTGVKMNDIARLYARIGAFRSLREFAYAVTNSARQRFQCEQASMGVVRDGKIELMCISGLDEIKKRSPGVHHIEQAMGECADAARPLAAQQRDRWEDDSPIEDGMLHQRWRAAAAGSCVLSVPVDGGDGPVAILSFRRGADQPFDNDDIQAAQEMLAPLAGAIPIVERATRPITVHAVASAKGAAAWSFRQGTWRRRVAIAMIVLAVAWFAVGSRTYHVPVPASVIAQQEHVVAAPIEGPVATVLVHAGDEVKAGQPLATMDAAALNFEHHALLAEVQSAELRVAEAMADDDPSSAAIAQGDLIALRARLRGVLRKLEDATILAPIDGIVIAPHLSELPGRVVAVGEPLLSIAASDSLTIELRVPQDRVADLTAGRPVRFASHARPEDPVFMDLDYLAPSSVEREGQSVFIAEAALTDHPDWVRPGMEGVAMVDAGSRPNWWLAVHRFTDAARMRFWLD